MNIITIPPYRIYGVRSGTPGNLIRPTSSKAVCKDQNGGYCQGKKLVVEKSQFDHLIDILVQDLQNPMKANWIFSNVFTDRVISPIFFLQFPKMCFH